MKIKSKKQFKDGVDAAFETLKTRDEAKACYDFQREEFKAKRQHAKAPIHLYTLLLKVDGTLRTPRLKRSWPD